MAEGLTTGEMMTEYYKERKGGDPRFFALLDDRFRRLFDTDAGLFVNYGFLLLVAEVEFEHVIADFPPVNHQLFGFRLTPR